MPESASPFSLHSRRAFITGSTQGVGAAIAIAIARAGGDVCLHGLRDDPSAQQTLAACRRFGVQAELLVADLLAGPNDHGNGSHGDGSGGDGSGGNEQRDNDLQWLADRVQAVMPGVDLLVNNAGTFVDVPFLEMDLARFETTMRLNVQVPFFLTQAFARRWVREGVAGRVLITGSINGQLAEADHVAYDTSKGGVAAMVRSLCVALAPHHIRVNSLAPGLVRTPLTGAVLDHDAELCRWMQWHTPNGAVPDASVCGDTAVYLLSDAARHVHGQTVLVDGGMSVWQQPDLPPQLRGKLS